MNGLIYESGREKATGFVSINKNIGPGDFVSPFTRWLGGKKIAVVIG
jgi:hypothetical protein